VCSYLFLGVSPLQYMNKDEKARWWCTPLRHDKFM